MTNVALDEQIIATLKNKVTRFAMAPAPQTGGDGVAPASPVDATVFEDAYSALLTLGLSPVDARNRLDQAATSGKSFQTVEELIGQIFRKP